MDNTTKDKYGNIALYSIKLIVVTLWGLSIVVVLSSKAREYFDIDATAMWAFGAVFGIFYVPMISPAIEKIVRFCAEREWIH